MKNRRYETFIRILIWIAIFVILIITYAFRFELSYLKNRVLSVIIPYYSWTNAQNQLIIARHSDGHFYLEAYSEKNKIVRFLVDTGATNIALTIQDAITLGVDISKLQYTQKYHTANGITYGAPTRIDKLLIGNKIFRNIEAHVTSGGLNVSLFGMSAIDDFKNFTISQDILRLE